jgi:hypothetical protein
MKRGMVMCRESNIHYRIDADDRIVSVCGGWDDFALANDGGDAVADRVLGRPLWDFIRDPHTCLLYRQILARVRRGGSATFALRCDGPSHRRLLEMTVAPLTAGGVAFVTRVLSAQDREPVALLTGRGDHSAEMIKACAWCNRVEVCGGAWAEVEDAVGRLNLFERGRVPPLSHGICDPCLTLMTAKLAELTPRPRGGAPSGGDGR